MMAKRWIEICVGVLMLLAAAALVFLALRVSGLSLSSFNSHNYTVTAEFTDIGALKVRAPVRIGGVEVGNVTGIRLDPSNFEAVVTLTLHGNIRTIPSDSSAKISSAGLLGDNYIDIQPGYASTNLQQGSVIQTTYSATNIASLISTFVSGGKK